MAIEGVVRQMKRVISQAEADKAAIPEQWSVQARRERLGEIDAAAKEELAALRIEGNQRLDEEIQKAAQAREQAVVDTGPQGEAAWAEAAARKVFIEEEIAEMAPLEIPAEYARLKKADPVGAWLVAREGMRDLEKRRADPEITNLGEVLQARRELEAAAWGKAESVYEKRIADLGKERGEISRIERDYQVTSERPVVRF